MNNHLRHAPSRLLILAAIVLFPLFSCSTSMRSQSDDVLSTEIETRPERQVLSQSGAIRRAKQVGDVHYDLYFEIGREDEFRSTTTLAFDLQDASDPLEIDFHKGNIQNLVVNGKEVPAPNYNGFYLTLANENLVVGANEVTIEFTRPYSNTGFGFYRFKDPEDGKFYLFTDFEPFSANSLFPCFDQPDLKATYRLRVLAPEGWFVISSVLERSTSKEGEKVLWDFPTSKKFSTYLFPLHAGPYEVWESDAGNVPLRLFARRSLAKYVRPDDWFTTTQQGFAFFEKYFDYPYPFNKYDQIIVPDFNAGAMENVGAVTFTEEFVERGTPTRESLEAKANTILHEMAHMWFGNLVTMKWWNDLWLNESFATYMANLALVEATGFKTAWQSFYSGTKQWAYWEDQLVTTHPIEASAPDTEQASANFDGITYGKGASVLKQVAFFLGKEDFRKGVAEYFKTYAYQNATLEDFMGSLAGAAGRDLDQWTQDWIRTSSLNTVEVEIHCEDRGVKTFALNQSSSEKYPTIRQHRTQVGLFYLSDGELRIGKEMQATYATESTRLSELEGEPCPDMVYPNYGDYDFVKVKLDPASLATARTSLSTIQDPFVRSMIWQSLWDMVRDGEYSVIDYSQLIFANLGSERDLKILNQVGQSISGPWGGAPTILLYLPKGGDRFTEFKAGYHDRLENFIWKQMQESDPGTDHQKFWLDTFIGSASTSRGEAQLAGFLAGENPFEGLEIDQDRRWKITRRLSLIGSGRANDLIDAELTRDASERGQQYALTARASQPSAARKRELIERVLSADNEMSLMRRQQIMWNLFPTEQESFRENFKDEFFETLADLVQGEEVDFTLEFADNLVPTYCTQTSVDELGAFIEHHPDLPPEVMKMLRVAQQEDRRCTMIRALATSSL